MATSTSFNWIYLGTSATVLDPTEGNTIAENRNSFLGTFGSTGSPLYAQIKPATMVNLGGSGTALDANNTASNDQFTTDIGAGTQTFVFDSSVQYNATVTYADGTTGTVTAVMVQSTTGELFLAPETGPNADTTAYESKPIVSINFTSVAQTGANLAVTRQVTGWDNGFVDGTAGNDLINGAYVEPIANGTDKIDAGDGTSGSATAWQDDNIRAGAGNDTVLSGLGNDTVDGGSGADSIDGGTGNDVIDGGTEADIIVGGDGNDSILGGAGTFNDTLSGGLGADTISGGDGADVISGGDGNDSLDGGLGADQMTGGLGSDVFTGLGIGDVVDGSEDAGNTDTDVLDLFGSGWNKANTNIIFSTPDHENGTVQFLDNLGNVIGTMTFSSIERLIPCFTPGTLIDTAGGPVPVEDLAEGDLVQTQDSGLRPIVWAGRRIVTTVAQIADDTLRPILIRRGALGNGLPLRDMRVSPQHRVLLSGAAAQLITGQCEVLVPAKFLVGCPGIAVVTAPRPVTYLHIMFDRHELVRSDGAWTESFQPGLPLLSGLGAAQHDEIVRLFPELATDDGLTAFGSARYSLKAYEARALATLVSRR